MNKDSIYLTKSSGSVSGKRMKLTVRAKLFIGFTFLLACSILVQIYTFTLTKDYIYFSVISFHPTITQPQANEIKDFLNSTQTLFIATQIGSSVLLFIIALFLNDRLSGSQRSHEQSEQNIINHDLAKELGVQDMRIDFLSMAAHDFRTPLTAIQGYAYLLQNVHESDPSANDYINRILVSCKNLANLIDNLLSVSGIEKSLLGINLKPTNLTETIKNVISNLKLHAETKKQMLDLIIKNELPIVMADSTRIGQVLSNLVANAVNYTNEGGEIVVCAQEKEGTLQVSVKDNGHGIPKETIPKLFTKFFRVTGKLEQGSKGTGIGLFISKSIVDLHNGKIFVESELGKGSTFVLVLPIAKPEEIASYNKKMTLTPSLTPKTRQDIITRHV